MNLFPSTTFLSLVVIAVSVAGYYLSTIQFELGSILETKLVKSNEGLKMSLGMLFKPTTAAITAVSDTNKLYKPATRPVALFFGGTSGIGEAMATQLANQTGGKAHIVLLGRNETAAKRIIGGFPKAEGSGENGSKYEFLKVDATSMKSVREATAKLNAELPKVNFIVLTTGFLTTKGRDPTPDEGIDRKLACNFYARFRFVYDMVGLVDKAAQNGEDVGVMTVLAAGRGGPVDTNDLGLVKGFSLRNAEIHAVTYTDATYEKFAEEHPKVSFTHIFPGTVSTPMTTNFPGMKYFLPLLKFAVVTPAQCAEIMWSRIWTTDPSKKTGSFQVNNHGQDIPTRNRYVTPESKTAIWNHAVEMTGERTSA